MRLGSDTGYILIVLTCRAKFRNVPTAMTKIISNILNLICSNVYDLSSYQISNSYPNGSSTTAVKLKVSARPPCCCFTLYIISGPCVKCG